MAPMPMQGPGVVVAVEVAVAATTAVSVAVVVTVGVAVAVATAVSAAVAVAVLVTMGMTTAVAVPVVPEMSNPARFVVAVVSPPMVNSCPALGETGTPPGDPCRARTDRRESISYSVVELAPATLLV